MANFQIFGLKVDYPGFVSYLALSFASKAKEWRPFLSELRKNGVKSVKRILKTDKNRSMMKLKYQIPVQYRRRTKCCQGLANFRFLFIQIKCPLRQCFLLRSCKTAWASSCLNKFYNVTFTSLERLSIGLERPAVVSERSAGSNSPFIESLGHQLGHCGHSWFRVVPGIYFGLSLSIW